MSFNCDKYQELATFIDEFRANVTVNKLNAGELRQNLAQLQEFFGQQIAQLVECIAQSYPGGEVNLFRR